MSTISSTLITRDQLKAKRTLVPIEELKPWTKNPRAIEKTDYKRLKERCAGIQFKPLLVMSDGTVLGGNMRLLAYDDLGKKMIWVSIIEFEDYAGGIVAYINGEMDIKEDGTARMFTTIEDGMVHYAITDNEEFGKYVDQELAELIQPLDLNLQDYKVNLGALKTLEDVKLNFGPSPLEVLPETEEPKKEDKKKTIKCPNCAWEFEV